MVEGFGKLELMRRQLDEKGLFTQFKKEENAEVVDLADEIKEEQEKTLDTVVATHVLSIDEADELGDYFTKNELIYLAVNKFQIKKANNLKLIELLIKMSELGAVPVKPARIVNCKRCGKEIDSSPIKKIPFWELQDKGKYCDSCDAYIKKLNETSTQVEL